MYVCIIFLLAQPNIKELCGIFPTENVAEVD